MNFVFFDTETTSTDNIFGQMLEFSAVQCNEELNIIDGPYTFQCRLRPGIIPEPKALLVTKKYIEEINSRSLSHYEMVLEIVKKSKEWTPSIWIGWNSIEFDFKWLQSALYQCLQYTNFHQDFGNKRADALTIARAAHFLDESILNVAKNKKGKNTFKLESLSKINDIAHEAAHCADSDTLATVGLAKLIKTRTPELWEDALKGADRSWTDQYLQTNLVCTLIETHYGKVKSYGVTYLGIHPIFKYPICMDLKRDPQEYIGLSGDELSKAIRKSPKLLRMIRVNHHPVILNATHLKTNVDYEQLSKELLEDRARLLRGNYKFQAEVQKILLNEVEETDQNILEIEEQIYKGPALPSDGDKVWLDEFETGDWLIKKGVKSNFEDPRYKELAERLIYEEAKSTLTKKEQAKLEKSIKRRLTSQEIGKWNTIGKSRIEMAKLREEGVSPEEEKILNSLEHYLTTLE
jgi:exodeoxyribonuclease-1